MVVTFIVCGCVPLISPSRQVRTRLTLGVTVGKGTITPRGVCWLGTFCMACVPVGIESAWCLGRATASGVTPWHAMTMAGARLNQPAQALHHTVGMRCGAAPGETGEEGLASTRVVFSLRPTTTTPSGTVCVFRLELTFSQQQQLYPTRGDGTGPSRMIVQNDDVPLPVITLPVPKFKFNRFLGPLLVV